METGTIMFHSLQDEYDELVGYGPYYITEEDKETGMSLMVLPAGSTGRGPEPEASLGWNGMETSS